MFQMLGVFSEFEAAMIRDRVRTGVARAKHNGTKSGRPIGRPKLQAAKVAAVKLALARGLAFLKLLRASALVLGRSAALQEK